MQIISIILCVQPMFTIDGGHDLTEITLDHLEGYPKSGPVRIGNGAYKQQQLDIYGELLDLDLHL